MINKKIVNIVDSELSSAPVGDKNFFYSEKLNKYVAKQPLKVDETVLRAADKLQLNLSWDNEGRINNLSYIEAKLLAQELGFVFLSPSEFWQIYDEALRQKDQSMLDSLRSDQFTEWLDVCYRKEPSGRILAREHPVVKKYGSEFRLESDLQPLEMAEGRPAWFVPENNIEHINGLPKKITTAHSDLSGDIWKYWSVLKVNEDLAAIRGYVMSSGTPSLDMDLPIGSRQPVLLLRPVLDTLPQKQLDKKLLERFTKLSEQYLSTIATIPGLKNSEKLMRFIKCAPVVSSLALRYGKELLFNQDLESRKIRELLIDMLGLLRILAIDQKAQVLDSTLSLIGAIFAPGERTLTLKNFTEFVRSSRSRLHSALQSKKKVILVIGHKNPDTDTAVSSLGEAYRNSLIDKTAEYIPVLQSERVPAEIAALLGPTIAKNIVLAGEQNYQKTFSCGHASWILVDQNVSEDVQKYAISIIDHHVLMPLAKKIDLPLTWEMAGSTIALITQKIYGMGLSFDLGLARIFYGATLMDTENYHLKKMTAKDALLMSQLKSSCDISDSDGFYQELMNALLNTNDAIQLFYRDYKEDGGFGFAVCKIKGGFDGTGEELKPLLFAELKDIAAANNKAKNLPVTLVKVVDYHDDNKTINRERMLVIANQYAAPQLLEKLRDLLKAIIKVKFSANINIKYLPEGLEYWGEGTQLSRKNITPLLEKLITAFNRYFYSPRTGLYVDREFLKLTDLPTEKNNKIKERFSTDRHGRIAMINYRQAKKLLDILDIRMLSLTEYWQVLRDAQESNDLKMTESLKHPGFVEMLDTVILAGETVIEHPQLDGEEYHGTKKNISIPRGEPGLIAVQDIDPETGFPLVVQDPRQYGKPELWRYWSPDAQICIATRGYIFLLGQPAFDTKIHPDDAFPNLGIRPCRSKIAVPRIDIDIIDNEVEITIE